MASKYLVRIPTPCHENWQEMTPDAKGRHCAVCQKSVVDFTTFTDAQIVNYFDNNRDENLCGRFRETQLKRPIAAANPSPVGWRPWAIAAAFVAGSTAAQAQAEPPVNRDIYGGAKVYNYLDEYTFLVDMKVQNLEKKPLCKIPVMINDGKGNFVVGGLTDEDGYLRLKLPENGREFILIVNENGDDGKAHLFFPQREVRTAQVSATIENADSPMSKTVFEVLYVKEVAPKQHTPIVVSGMVVDKETKEPQIGALVTYDTVNLHREFSNEYGIFSFELPSDYAEDSIRLKVMMIGYENMEVTIPINQAKGRVFEMTVQEEVFEMVLGMPVYVEGTISKPSRPFFRRLFSRFRR